MVRLMSEKAAGGLWVATATRWDVGTRLQSEAVLVSSGKVQGQSDIVEWMMAASEE